MPWVLEDIVHGCNLRGEKKTKTLINKADGGLFFLFNVTSNISFWVNNIKILAHDTPAVINTRKPLNNSIKKPSKKVDWKSTSAPL